MLRRIAIAALFLLGACAMDVERSSEVEPAAGGHQVYLVRHAEKQPGDNPALTEDGQHRAEILAEILAGKGITHIHSTDYKRTLETAAPLASQSGIQVGLYDASDLEAFAETLVATPGIHLVVGHSNTTPQLAEALGGDPGREIDEKAEYDRLYIISFGTDGVSSEIERYGKRHLATEKSPTN